MVYRMITAPAAERQGAEQRQAAPAGLPSLRHPCLPSLRACPRPNAPINSIGQIAAHALEDRVHSRAPQHQAAVTTQQATNP